jgi:hypothetical protein
MPIGGGDGSDVTFTSAFTNLFCSTEACFTEYEVLRTLRQDILFDPVRSAYY